MVDYIPRGQQLSGKGQSKITNVSINVTSCDHHVPSFNSHFTRIHRAVFKLFPFSTTQSKEQVHLYSYMFCFVVRSPFTHFYNLGYYRRVPVYFAVIDLTWNKTAVIYG